MPDKRAWLRTQGFTVGERGRFSQEMLDALAQSELTFDTNNVKTINTRNGTVTIEKRIRKPNGEGKPKPAALPEIGWTDPIDIKRSDLPDHYIVKVPAGNGRTAHNTVWEICYKCGYSIQFCIDPRPVMPPWMDRASVVLEPVTQHTLTLPWR